MKRKVFTGIQPTGRLHIGNYLGTMKHWIELQETYNCIFGIVDYHAITVPFSPEEMRKRIFDCALVFLTYGMDSDKATIMLQSLVPQHTELAWIFNCISPVQELMRVPTFKDKRIQYKGNVNMGLLDYPVLMSADILIYKAEFVPVGDDQIPHIEMTREIAREFNKRFGNTFPEPKEIVRPRILGLDGMNKMSKTLGNCIYLDESPDEIWKKLAPAVTDTRRKKRDDPGEPDECNIFDSYHKGFSPQPDLRYIVKGCRDASIGCLDCKRLLFDNMIKELTPAKERMEALRERESYVMELIIEGSKKARGLAEETLREVKEKIGFLI